MLIFYSDVSIWGDKHSSYLNLGALEDVNISLELTDWLFALESMEVMSEMRINDLENPYREERSWHTCFESIKVQANGSKNDTSISEHNHPVEVVRVCIYLVFEFIEEFLLLFSS